MFSSFKNTELFRYFIRVDLNRSIDKILEQNESNYLFIADCIFSAAFSVIGTYLTMYNECNDGISLKRIIMITFLFLILFFIGMYIFKYGYGLLRRIRNAIKKENMASDATIKQLIDDFDHIACDNILISQNFIGAYFDNSTSSNLKEFYFYEIIYYTNVSLAKINSITLYKDRCIDNNETSGKKIHLYRLGNALSMLNEICDFLENNKNSILLESSLKESLFAQIDKLHKSINEQTRKYNEIKQELLIKSKN